MLGSPHRSPHPPYGSGRWRSTVLGRQNTEPPENRGPLAEDPTSGPSPLRRARDRRGKGGVHSRGGHSRGLPARSCCKVLPPGLGRMVSGHPWHGGVQRLPGAAAASFSSSSAPCGCSSGPARGLSAEGSGDTGRAACSGGASRGASRRDDPVVLGPAAAAAPEVPDGPVALEPPGGGPAAPPEVPAPTGCQMRL